MDLPEYLGLVCWVSWLFISWWVAKLKNHTGVHRRAREAERKPERGAKRRTEVGAELWGPTGAPRVFSFTTHRENKVKILSKKVRDTQANPSYSTKNNVAIRMIATFMLIFLKSPSYTIKKILKNYLENAFLRYSGTSQICVYSIISVFHLPIVHPQVIQLLFMRWNLQWSRVLLPKISKKMVSNQFCSF